MGIDVLKRKDVVPKPVFNKARLAPLFLAALFVIASCTQPQEHTIAPSQTASAANTISAPNTPQPVQPVETFTPTIEARYLAQQIIKINFFGDLSIGRLINKQAFYNEHNKDNPYDLFSDAFKQFLLASHLNLANFESAIIDDPGNCPLGGSHDIRELCGSSEFIPPLQGLKLAFTTANNHSHDRNGYSNTKAVLSENSIPFVNSHYPESEFIFIEENEITVGILGFDFISHFEGHYDSYKQEVIEKIQKYKDQVDHLIVSLHWGQDCTVLTDKDKQYCSTEPSDVQREFAHAFIDAGATIIHGHHNHVIPKEPVEIYQGKNNYLFQR